jgi:imidazolonepropionase-like amidohydrolase
MKRARNRFLSWRSAGAWTVSATAVLCLGVVAVASASDQAVVIEGCNLFDPETGTMLPDRTILIRGSQIVRVSGGHDVGDLPPEARRIDGRGKFALPGLIDAHVHVVHVLLAAPGTRDAG